jgi:hypothetical protein
VRNKKNAKRGSSFAIDLRDNRADRGCCGRVWGTKKHGKANEALGGQAGQGPGQIAV